MTGSYDPALNLVYYGTGNPNPDYYGDDRSGDNLYSCSLRRARRRHRQAEVALPVHAARRARLGLGARPGAGRSHDRRPAAESRHGRQPQRLLLHAQSRDRKAARREAVHRRLELGEGNRRGRTADRPRQHRHAGQVPARQPRRHELPAADVRSRTPAVLRHRARDMRDLGGPQTDAADQHRRPRPERRPPAGRRQGAVGGAARDRSDDRRAHVGAPLSVVSRRRSRSISPAG